MSQIYVPTSSTNLPTNVPTSFVTNSGTAIPVGNILNVLGNLGLTTSGSGNTVTITQTEAVSQYVNVVGPQTYVVTATDEYISCNSTSGVVTIQLPNAAIPQYKQFIIKDRTGTSPSHNVIITTVGGTDIIDGATTYTFTDPYESLEILWNGTTYETF